MLEVFGDFEDRNKMFVDHDLFAGPRIACHPALALFYFEASESPDLDVSSGLQSVDDGGDETIHYGLCFHLRQPCGRRDDVYDICFGQAASRENWKKTTNTKVINPTALVRNRKLVLNDGLTEELVADSGQTGRCFAKHALPKRTPFVFLHHPRLALDPS